LTLKTELYGFFETTWGNSKNFTPHYAIDDADFKYDNTNLQELNKKQDFGFTKFYQEIQNFYQHMLSMMLISNMTIKLHNLI
jgi:hypothetical protein